MIKGSNVKKRFTSKNLSRDVNFENLSSSRDSNPSDKNKKLETFKSVDNLHKIKTNSLKVITKQFATPDSNFFSKNKLPESKDRKVTKLNTSLKSVSDHKIKANKKVTFSDKINSKFFSGSNYLLKYSVSDKINVIKESDNCAKIKELILRMGDLIENRLRNLDYTMMTENFTDTNINSDNYFVENQNSLKFGLIKYEIESIIQEVQEFNEELKIKNNIKLDPDMTLNIKSDINCKNDLDNYNNSDRYLPDLSKLLNLSQERISYYKNCFKICSNSLNDINKIISSCNNKQETNQNLKNFISNSNNNFTFNLNFNLGKLVKDNIEEKVKENSKINKSINNETKFKSYQRQIKNQKPKKDESLIDNTFNMSNINENIQINLPSSKINNIKKPLSIREWVDYLLMDNYNVTDEYSDFFDQIYENDLSNIDR